MNRGLAAVAAGCFAELAVAGGATTLARRVAADFPKMPESGICCYAVPATGERQYLPDVYPEDGIPGGPVSIIAARDEYEPGSFVLYSAKDLGKVRLEVGDLKQVEKVGGGGERLTGVVFPKENLDLKVVKVWYQNGNGWYSYFQDVGVKLCPELLLNDEDLVRVDEKTKDNYARLIAKDGTKSEVWITAPRSVSYARSAELADGGWINDPLACMKEDFQDAPTFQGATLQAGRCKQFFLTAHVGKDVKPGLYKGEIRIRGQGERSRSTSTSTLCTIPVTIRVLDFTLPKPKCYFNVEKDFATVFCEYVGVDMIMQLNGGNRELAKKQLVAILKNYVRHGYTSPMFRDKLTPWGLKIAKELGFDYSHCECGWMLNSTKAEMRLHADLLAKKLDRDLGGHKGHLLSWGDEFGLETLRGIRDMVRIYNERGFRQSTDSRYSYDAAGNMVSLFFAPVNPDGSSAEDAAKFRELGDDGLFGWYANHHVGTENPAFIRRQYGFGPYRAGFSLNFNYAQHLNGWNDVADDPYKPMNLIYGTGNGCVDTLAWEGFREGLDDIRYATLLKTLALPLSNSDNVDARYTAKLALKCLADADGDDMDLATLRLEMINWIEKLRKL